MNLLKLNLLFNLIIYVQSSYASICVNTSSNYKMFGSALRSGALVRGHELAFQDNNFTDYKFFSSNNDLELVQQVQNMTEKSNCAIFLGFYTSRECLIAGPIFKKNQAIGLSPSCSHDDMSKFTSFIYTAVPALSQFSITMADYLKKTSNLGKIYVVYQSTDIYSVKGFTEFKKNFNATIISVPVASDGKFNTNLFNYNKEEPVTIVFFSYPLPSANILLTLAGNNLITKNISIMGAPSWIFDVSVFESIKSVLKQTKEILVTDVLDWNKIRKEEFIKNFIKNFHRPPLTIELLNYDVTKSAIYCYKKSLIKNKYNKYLLQKCITEEVHIGISGKFSFNKLSPFADRKIYITNLLDRM